MKFFEWMRNKKQTVAEKFIKVECNHKWKDFPWYFSGTYYEDTKRYNLKIIKPYVCIHCKARKDIVLNEINRSNYSWEDGSKTLDYYAKKYDQYCEPRPVVENMINDMQLVDKEYLKLIEEIRSGTDKVPKLEIKN